MPDHGCPSTLSCSQTSFSQHGYKMELLHNERPQRRRRGAANTCTTTPAIPALLVIGQMIDALQSGKYDLDKTALIITQTGGGCRASNYIHLLRKALQQGGAGVHPGDLPQPVRAGEATAASRSTLPHDPPAAVAAIVYGDVLMLLTQPGAAL